MVRGLCPWFLVYGGPNEYSFFCDGPTLPDYVSDKFTMYNGYTDAVLPQCRILSV